MNDAPERRDRSCGIIVAIALLAIVSACQQAPRPMNTASGPAPGCYPAVHFDPEQRRGVSWRTSPSIVILMRRNDVRVKLVHDAADFWNRQFAEMGSGFRMGAISTAELAYDDEFYARTAGRFVITRDFSPPPPPPVTLSRHCGSIVVVLADDDFISFARPISRFGFVLVGIKGEDHPPFHRHNVMRNVIAHEMGHAIGLRHNDDPATLMCGRPAPCRATLYESSDHRYFPLTEGEKRFLLRNYPAGWRDARGG